VGLYFSADWCAPCKRFTPKLITAYNGPLAICQRWLRLVLWRRFWDPGC